METNTVEERLREFCYRCDNNCCEREVFLDLYLFIAPENAKDIVRTTKKCYYFKDGKCLNYDSRPPACRFYPFSNGKKGPFLDIHCPVVSGDHEKPPILEIEFLESSWLVKLAKHTTNIFHQIFSNDSIKNSVLNLSLSFFFL